MGLGFGPGARISNRKDFKQVFIRGRKLVGRNLILWAARTCSGTSEPGPTRLGLAVSGKLGNAVRRNRLKRLAREAFRLSRARLARGWDLVVYLRVGCRWLGCRDAQKDLLELCRKGGVLKS